MLVKAQLTQKEPLLCNCMSSLSTTLHHLSAGELGCLNKQIEIATVILVLMPLKLSAFLVLVLVHFVFALSSDTVCSKWSCIRWGSNNLVTLAHWCQNDSRCEPDFLLCILCHPVNGLRWGSRTIIVPLLNINLLISSMDHVLCKRLQGSWLTVVGHTKCSKRSGCWLLHLLSGKPPSLHMNCRLCT